MTVPAPVPARRPALLVNLHDPAYPADRLGPREPLALEYVRADLERAGIPYLWADPGNDPLGPAPLSARLRELDPPAVVAHGAWTALVENGPALAEYRRDRPEAAVVLLGPGLAAMADDLLDALAYPDAVAEDEAAGAVSAALLDRLRGLPALQRPGIVARGRLPAPPEAPPPRLAPSRASARRWAREGLVPTIHVRATEPGRGGAARLRPAAAVLAEIEGARAALGAEGMDPLVRLVGADAFAPAAHADLEEFAEELLEARTPPLLEMEARVADLWETPEALLRFLQQTGLRLLRIDLAPRTPDEALRDGLGIDEERFARLVRTLRAAGIDVQLAGLALLHPFQTLKGWERASRTLETLHLSYAMHALGRAELFPRSPMLLACLKESLLSPSYELGRLRDYAFRDPAVAALAESLDGPGWEALYDEIECARGIGRELVVLDEQAERSGALSSRRFKLLYLGERSKVAWALRSLADVTGDHLRTSVLERLRRGRAPTWSDWRRHLRHVSGVADFVHLAYAKFIQRIQEARAAGE